MAQKHTKNRGKRHIGHKTSSSSKRFREGAKSGRRDVSNYSPRVRRINRNYRSTAGGGDDPALPTVWPIVKPPQMQSGPGPLERLSRYSNGGYATEGTAGPGQMSYNTIQGCTEICSKCPCDNCCSMDCIGGQCECHCKSAPEPQMR